MKTMWKDREKKVKRTKKSRSFCYSFYLSSRLKKKLFDNNKILSSVDYFKFQPSGKTRSQSFFVVICQYFHALAGKMSAVGNTNSLKCRRIVKRQQ